jgi:Ca-activated chloride channel family protein
MFSLGAIAQTSTTAQAAQDSSGVFEVRLPITVKNKKDMFVSGLTKDDFIVLEDKKPQEVTFFQDEKNNPPVYVGVLMDTSPSTAGKMRFSKEAAKNFIYSVVRLRKDKVAFATFDHEIKLRQDFSDKLDMLDRAVDNVKETGNKTSLYDAIYQFCDEKLRGAKGRRVIVVITDGDDTFSRAELSDAIDIAQRTETTIFAISTKAGFLGSVPGVEAGTIKDEGDKDLTRLCEETGGEVFFTGDMIALEKAFTRISKELQTQYILTYKPENQVLDGKVRQIEVRLVDRGDNNKHKLRTKKEYKAVRDTIRAN